MKEKTLILVLPLVMVLYILAINAVERLAAINRKAKHA